MLTLTDLIDAMAHHAEINEYSDVIYAVRATDLKTAQKIARDYENTIRAIASGRAINPQQLAYNTLHGEVDYKD